MKTRLPSSGPIRPSTIYGVLPLEDTLTVSRISGRDLPTVLSEERTVFADVEQKPDRFFVLTSGEPLDPERRYEVVSTDYLDLKGERCLTHRTRLRHRHVAWHDRR